jgi:RNA polymerase sigma factor (sigma-70 family)
LTATASLPALIERAIAGDERAWAAIVDRFAPLLWSICRRFGFSAHEVDDVAQAVWLRLLDHLSTLRTPEALPGWLATTTRRECLRYAQAASGRLARQAPLTEALSNSAPDEADEVLLQAERRDALRAAFGVLGERCRHLLVLLLRDPPPPYSEISAELGVPVGSIGPTRARCLDNLRRAPELAALINADIEPSEEARHVDPVER